MRREGPGSGRRSAALAALSVLMLSAGPALAGLRLLPDAGSPRGADVRALAQAGGVFWAGTASGVFRGGAIQQAEGWTLDGLAGLPITSLAVSGEEVWAATGEELWRRSAPGTWAVETLPAPPGFPTAVAAVAVDATGTVWAGGLGAWRRTGGTWSAAPSPGVGLVVSMLPDPPGLVAGLSTGSAARWNGAGWTAYSGGVGPGESFQALSSFGGTLWAGTNITLYAWGGSAWVVDAAFGRHDVRALTTAGGSLRVATADAGVLVRSGSSWVPDSAGILPRGAQAFLESGPDLLVGTMGGPVYRRAQGGWSAASGPEPAAVLSDAVPVDASVPLSRAFGAALGAGCQYVLERSNGGAPDALPELPRLPDGCGNATAVVRAAGSPPEALVATSCGPYLTSGTTIQLAGTGLPAGLALTTLASTPSGIFGGAAENGLWRFSGSTWSVEPVSGYIGTGTVNVVRQTGGALWVAMVEGLFRRPDGGTWSDASAGLPSAGLVASLGGDASTTFAGLATGGVYRRAAAGPFQRDAAGLNAAPVLSLDLSGGRMWAAAGARGLATRRDGGWAAENSGLPAGARVTLVRDMGLAGPTEKRTLLVGTAGHGTWRAEVQSAVRTLPVVLDVVGATGARFLSELVIGSRSGAEVTLPVTYTPAGGFAGPGGTLAPKSANLTIPARSEIRAADALGFLRSLGMAIPAATPGGPVAGSLTIEGPGPTSVDDVYVIARTYTGGAAGGTFGLFYGGASDLDAAEEEATVYGLRSVPGDARSNLAVVHLPGRGTDPIEVAVQVYSASGTPAGDPLVRSLAPGEWYQWNGILPQSGLPDGAFGYARIRRTSGVGAFVAYGVVNDARTSDGSYLPAIRPGGLAAARTVVVPVVLDVFGAAGSHFTTEVTLVNDGSIATPADLVYRPAPGFGEAGGVPVVTVDLAAGEQRTIPDVLAYLRSRGVQIPDGTVAAQAGTLTVTFRYLTGIDAPSTVVLARTTTPNPDTASGGTFGLFYAGVAKGGGARTEALVPGLKSDDGVRSNLAVVHVGGGSELPVTVEARLYDADTGAATGSPLSVRLSPGDWVQWSGVHDLAGAPASVKRFYAVVRRTSGDDTFLAYGVLNDAVTSDGSFQTMIPSDSF